MILENIEFLNPEFFWLLVLLPIAGVWYYNNRKRQTATLRMSSVAGMAKMTVRKMASCEPTDGGHGLWGIFPVEAAQR